MRISSRLLLLSLLPLLAAPPLASAQDSKLLRGITRPRRDVTISFVQPGRVAELLVKRNDPIKAGGLIAKQDDSVEQKALEMDRADATDETEIFAEQTVLEHDKVSLEKYREKGTPFEIREAELKVKIDDARIKLAQEKKRKATIKVTATEAQIERLNVHHSSEFDGVVAEIFLKQGETADGQNMKVARIIQLDPLWIEVSVPTLQARRLKKADPASVSFLDGKDRPAKVDEISVLADPATDMIMVRLELPNPEKLQPGETVWVRFGPAAGPVVANPQPRGN